MHDIVDVTVRGWSRRVVGVSVVERRGVRPAVIDPAARPSARSPAAAWLGGAALGGAIAGAGGAAAAAGGATATGGVGGETVPPLTGEEVGRALGAPIASVRPMTAALGMATITYLDGDDDPLLLTTVATGLMASMALRARRHHSTPLSGIGDEAYAGDFWAVAAVEGTVVTLVLTGSARGRYEHLPWLLHRAVERLRPRR